MAILRKGFASPDGKKHGVKVFTISETASHLSAESQELINKMAKDHEDEIGKISKQMLVIYIAAQLE